MNEVTGAPVYTGFLSQVTLLLWSGAAAVSFVGYFALRTDLPFHARYLRSAAVLTTIFMIDDAFLFHDRLLPFLFGIPVAVTYAAYGVLFCALLWNFRKALLTAPYHHLVLALLFGAAAAVFDLLDAHPAVSVLPSNALKLFAVGMWLVYFADYTVRHLRGSAPGGARG